MQACVCEQILKSSQKIKITMEKKKFGKPATIISGFETGMDVKKIKPILVKRGFDGDSISE